MEHQWQQRVAEFLGMSSELPTEALHRYGRWLVDEAIPAGGLATADRERVMIRHVADSLLFSRFLPTATPVWDLGTGVGLPGIPLALLRPSQSFVLVERSRRRVSLVRRAVRILDLENVEVVEGDIHQLAAGSIGAMVARASLPPEVMGVIVQRCVRSGGIAVVGGSWVRKPISPGWETVPVPRDVLDHDIWLLIMRRQ